MRHHRLGRLVASTLLTLACAPVAPAAGRPPVPESAAAGPPLDSLVVERSPCFGTCPVYQFVVRRDGHVALRTGGESSGTRDFGVQTAHAVLNQVIAAGLGTLPPQILGDPALCPVAASDHATIRLTGYTADTVRNLVHYTGCYAQANPLEVTARLRPLLALEARVQALADRVTAGAARR